MEANLKSTNKLNLLVSIIHVFGLCACNASVMTATSTQPVLTSTSTPIFSPNLAPALTEIQPVSESSGYCQLPSAFLPVEDGNDVSEDEIVYKLLDMWLRRYSSPNAPPDCRIDKYIIDRVYFDLDVTSQQLEPRGDFMRVVVFSVKLIQTSNHWMGFSGELDRNNWLHLSQVVAAFRTNEGYIIKFAYP